MISATAAPLAAPVYTGNKDPLTRVTATPYGSQPYITNDSDSDDGYLPPSQTACTVRLRSGQVYYFAVALRLDGSAATGGEPQADASAVETSLVSACSGVASATGVLFADGFETGNTSRWSQTVPQGTDPIAQGARHFGGARTARPTAPVLQRAAALGRRRFQRQSAIRRLRSACDFLEQLLELLGLAGIVAVLDCAHDQPLHR